MGDGGGDGGGEQKMAIEGSQKPLPSASGRQSRIAPSELPIPSRAVKYSSHAFAVASIWVHHLPSVAYESVRPTIDVQSNGGSGGGGDGAGRAGGGDGGGDGGGGSDGVGDGATVVAALRRRRGRQW